MSATANPIEPAPALPADDMTIASSKRVLDPFDRVSEVLFGLIMVMTITGSLSIAEVGRDSIRATLLTALGCNFAWGIIDAILYLMESLADKGKGLALLKAVRGASDPAKASRLVAEALTPVLKSAVTPADLEILRQRVLALPTPPPVARLKRQDWIEALGVFLLVFLSTFPVVIPFLFMSNVLSALRLSHLIAVAMLFFVGCAYGRLTGRRPLGVGLAMVFLGSLLAGMTMLLGG